MVVLDKQRVWIAWERHRRSIELSSIFGYKLKIFETDRPRYLKYPIFVIKTIAYLLSVRPKKLIVQNPSIVLTLLAVILKPVLRYQLIVDCHNASVTPDDKFLHRIYFILAFCHKYADHTIVTNEALAKIIRRNGGKPLVLIDALPRHSISNSIVLRNSFNVFCVTTFAIDEPWEELISTAKLFQGRCHFYFSGNFKKIEKTVLTNLPDNVSLLGFIPEKDYWGYLSQCDLAIDLTLRENCLVCGAYEALSISKPMILSDTEALRKCFYKGFYFTKNEQSNIEKSIEFCMQNIDVMKDNIADFKVEFEKKWIEHFDKNIKPYIY